MDQWEIKQHTIKKVNEMVKFLREHYNEPLFNVSKLTVSFSPHRRRSWGGAVGGYGFVTGRHQVRGKCSFAFNRFLTEPEVKNFHEYEKIASHPTIGMFCGSKESRINGTIAHEVAHAFDWYLSLADSKKRNQVRMSADSQPGFRPGREFKGHERSWQLIYHLLREKFVNKLVTPPVKEQPEISNPNLFVLNRYLVPKKVKYLFAPTSGKMTNIDRVCEYYRKNTHLNQYDMIAGIQALIGVKRGNAMIYLDKARKRCN